MDRLQCCVQQLDMYMGVFSTCLSIHCRLHKYPVVSFGVLHLQSVLTMAALISAPLISHCPKKSKVLNVIIDRAHSQRPHQQYKRTIRFLRVLVVSIQLVMCVAVIVNVGSSFLFGQHSMDIVNNQQMLSDKRSKKNWRRKHDDTNRALLHGTWTLPQQQQHPTLPLPSQQQAQAALAFVLARKQYYSVRKVPFHMRGIGWLYEHHGVILTAVLRKASVDVYNVGTSIPCEKLTIWVRVAGSEVLAGKAESVLANKENATLACYWSFPMKLSIPGTYNVESKVLLYNSQAKVSACTIETSIQTMPFHEFTDHNSLTGFKFYTPHLSCCEICSRDERCKHWFYPPLSGALDGCEFYYKDSIIMTNASSTSGRQHSSRRRLLGGDVPLAHGPPRHEPTAHFLGCGWSFYLSVDFPCLSNTLDDQVHMMTNTIVVNKTRVVAPSPTNQRPPCSTLEEMQSQGRWVRMDDRDCPLVFDDTYNTLFNITKHNGESPKCWHRDDLSIIGQMCKEAGCANWLPMAWMSSFKSEPWYGRWEPYKCEYLDLTNQQLQKCLDSKQISSISMEGASISRFLNQYLQQRVDGLVFANKSDLSKNVVVTTLSFPHLLWTESEDGWLRELQSRPEATSNDIFFWVSGFFYSSEREPYVHLGRAEKLNALATRVLGPKGYTTIQAMDMTAAFTYDSATQMDGLHIIGPPMKMIITKLFHHMCHDAIA